VETDSPAYKMSRASVSMLRAWATKISP
jgi:hypothetical protein